MIQVCDHIYGDGAYCCNESIEGLIFFNTNLPLMRLCLGHLTYYEYEQLLAPIWEDC